MEHKHTKLLFVASIISLILGLFLICCGILEFTDILYTRANNVIESIGIQLSYLVFISGILVFLSGFISLLDIKTMKLSTLQLIISIFSLAWPIFVSIALFFAQRIICIRLLPTMLSSLFYIVALLIVLISNDDLRAKKVRISPSSIISSFGKRKSGVNVSNVFQATGKATSQKVDISNIGNILKPTKKRSRGGFNFYGGSRRRGGFNIRNIGNLFSGRRRR